ncbi:MAG: hypothetical protein LQ337_006750 [Flavoplaca oasis]|nr:MAG: hypothetical protein LQ337_006750 [Flavoplaca oasis]
MLAYFLPAGTIALSYLLHYAEAAPGLAPTSASSLTKRNSMFVGCDDKQRTKAGQAAADMANLALHAYNEASADKYGFNHYFKDDELAVFKSAMSTIQQNNDPTNAPYNFIINCSPTGDEEKRCKKGKGSYAITDITVPKDDNDHKSMWLCPLFFTGDDAKNDLPNTQDGDKLKAWCDQKDYTLFPTAGHILLHEITHLDAVAKKWLPDDANEDGEHGTEDFAQSSRPIRDARRLKDLVDKIPDRDDVPAPRFNAESYAGAATELWAQKFCKKEFIPPKNGYET